MPDLAFGRRGVLQARQIIEPHIVGHGERLAFGVGRHQRAERLVELEIGVGLDDLRAVLRGQAARQPAVGAAGDRVGRHRIAERERGAGIERLAVLLHVAAGLREAIVGEHLLAGGDVRHQPVEHHAAGFVLVEAEIEEVVQEASALRDAERDGVVDAAGDRIGRAGCVGGFAPQERHDVARRGEAHAHHLGVFRGVDEFVDRAGVEAGGPLDRDLVRRLEGEAQVGRRDARIGLALAHRQRRLGRIEIGRRIGEGGRRPDCACGRR